ncbi:hypothetical protein I302_108802 [Kwoniella bestiolae CBS 10118]|uniref:non-specific serine/threonine protein kinase n=1 Tax=Kwoniella bestiolae CBS 10118 TaxID=1296100 RepID=A0A1B9FU58_9TREE|nr:AGC protein kinase [Kwoniella bestiolae CBS 10118]OCF22294.1 AGC protein kinase [Kwoniella bestiolae CBS 10118]
MLGPPTTVPLPPSPPYSGDDSSQPTISHLVPPNGLTTPDRTPSLSSSFGEASSPTPHGRDPSPSYVDGRRQDSTSDGSSKRYVPRLEDFQLIRVLGKGCAGRVLLVKHTPTNNIRAMKAISKRSVLTHDELNHTLTEQSILKRFAIDEPNNRFVSRLHSSFTDRENFYFVMEFYPGGDLATQMELHGILGDHRTRFYAADITQGLEDLHRHGIIVRDLKPENILLNSKGHAVLADFGLSKEFSYRGDPKPIHVVTYPGQPALPPWAGQGAGSLRTLASGQKKLVVDKAYSFVGTSEYLSPEVVKRGEYTYAVDWWALGCIVLEGLVGRVPFRKADDEPPMVLWNRILFDPWDELFHDPKMARFMPDPVTYNFIDALLQKDPMWRLTEPCVKQHDYFVLLDWDTVNKGEYQDPHGLKLHPIAEYNTHYFPKLCLEEDPSVDMSTHEFRGEDNFKKTPLNDNALYALEQAKYRYELEGFAWTREEDGYETVEESEMEYSVAAEEEEHRVSEDSENKIPIELTAEDISPGMVEAEGGEPDSAIGGMTELGEERYKDEEDIVLQPTMEVAEASVPAPSVASPVILPKEASLLGSPASAYSTNLPSVTSAASPDPVMGRTSPEDISVEMLRNAEPVKNNSAAQPDLATSIENVPASTSPRPSIDKDLPPMPKVDVARSNSVRTQAQAQSPVSPQLSTHSIHSHPVPIPLRPKPVRQLSEEINLNLNLPPGLPASGLSVSDIVTVPSPHPCSPTRIVRRHPQLPSVDTIPIARLSVELHGVRTYIDDEEWEELSIPEGPNASLPNGNGHGNGRLDHSFLGLGRVLKRRPSTLIGNGSTHVGGGSGLKRQIKNSDTSSSKMSGSTSPSKSPRPNLFSTKSIENTKKAFKFGNKLKTFPVLKSLASPPEAHSNTSRIVTPSGTDRLPITNTDNLAAEKNKEERPKMGYRRHTESGSGWLGRKKKISSIIPSTSSSTSSSMRKESGATSSNPPSPIKKKSLISPEVGAEAGQGDRTVSNSSSVVSVSKDKKGLPKLELDDIELTGLGWEPFDGKEWGVK